MKVLLRSNIRNLGQIGDVVEVKPGYARNYLLPQRLAVEPTEANVREVEARKAEYLAELARQRQEIEARAQAVSGKEITISARANEEGHLYGSVGPAQISATLAEEGLFVEPSEVHMDQPIRQLDKYDVELRFEQDVTATIHVWVVPVRDETEPDEEADESETESTDEPETETETDRDDFNVPDLSEY